MVTGRVVSGPQRPGDSAYGTGIPGNMTTAKTRECRFVGQSLQVLFFFS